MATSRLPIFQERFKELRGELTQQQFSEKLGISRPSVGLYESGARIPDAEILQEIAVKCGVSVDWLLGLSKYPTNDPDIQMICGTTGLSESALLTLQSQIIAPNGRPALQVSQVIDFILSDYSFLDDVMGSVNDAIQCSKPARENTRVKDAIKTAGENGYILLTSSEASDFFLSQAMSGLKEIFREMLDEYSVEDSNGEYQED